MSQYIAPSFASPPPRRRPLLRSTTENALAWASAGVARAAPKSSPVTAVDNIIYYASDLTRSAERLTRSAGMALATGGVIPSMFADDAKSTLKFVACKVSKRAREREAEEAEAAAVEEAKKARVGAAREAKRAAIAARPVKVHRAVNNLGQVHVW